MALGLFASLLIGTIFNTLGDKLNISLYKVEKTEDGKIECPNFGKQNYIDLKI